MELEKNRQPGRPFLLIVLAGGFLFYALTGWLRLYLAISDWQVLASLGLIPGPLYLAIYGTAAGLFGMAGAVSLWSCQPWAPGLARVGSLVAAAWYWLDRLIFTRSAASWINWPFSTGVTVICLAFVFLILAAPRQEKFFLSARVKPDRIVKERAVTYEQNK